jgi:dolichol-phosphate mannosyltransferase
MTGDEQARKAPSSTDPRAIGPVWLVLPTYQEIENIEPVLRAVHAALSSCDLPAFRILVVDDSSPDGTAERARAVSAELPQVEVLVRPQRQGLGRAYVHGFTHAVLHGADVLLQMDADFSHDPADIPRLVAAVRDGNDMAIGSRYTPGGGVADWGLSRRLLSRGGSVYARLVLGLDVADLTGGFKCFRAAVLQAIEPETIEAQGYAFQIEVTNRAVRAGFRVVEVPIVFRDREHGTSKMNARIAAEALLLVPRLRRKGRG